jgi:hypothetical protein
MEVPVIRYRFYTLTFMSLGLIHHAPTGFVAKLVSVVVPDLGDATIGAVELHRNQHMLVNSDGL